MLTREEALDTMGATLDDWIDKKNMHMLIDKIYDEHEAQIKEANRIKEDFRKVALDLDAEASELREQMKAKDEEIERLFGLITSLWQIIDDIDTYGDMAKSDDALFRSLVEKKQKERWKLPITTDGYEVILKDKA